MKGLLQKDISLTFAYCRSLLLVSMVFMVTTIWADETSAFRMFPGMYLSIISLTLYSVDEREGWLRYALTLPVDRETLVGERYFYNLIVVGIGGIMLLLCGGVRLMLTPEGGVKDLLEALLLYFISGMIAPSINLPLMYKLGAEKGRVAYLATVSVVMIAAFTLVSVTEEKATGEIPLMGMLGILLLLGVVYILSWRLSVSFFRKREL